MLRRVSHRLRFVLYFAANQHNRSSGKAVGFGSPDHKFDTVAQSYEKKLYNLCIAYLTCADENGHEFGERTELIKKLSGKLQNNRRTVQWLEMPTSVLFMSGS